MSKKSTERLGEMKRLQAAIERKNLKDALSVLRNYTNLTSLKSDVRNYRCRYEENGKITKTDDTILHLAAAMLDERHNVIIEEIVKLSPDLLASGKKSEAHEGQTPLHILIVRKQNDTLRRIKDLLLFGELQIGETVSNNISNPTVKGQIFKKTVMEGELPHIVAALTLDIDTAKLVIEMTKSDIKAQNSKGNTVYHCLVKHAARFPEDMQEVTVMWNFLGSLVGDNQTDGEDENLQAAFGFKYALRQINKDLMRPLQLAAELGVAKLFNKILESEKILNVKERLFDTYLYDISVIDTVAHYKIQRENEKQHQKRTKAKKSSQIEPSDNIPPSHIAGDEDLEEVRVGEAVKTKKFKYSQSVLQMLCNRTFAENKASAFEMIRQPAMKMLIDLKWKACRCSFYACAIAHILIMIWYSIFASQWAFVAFPSNSTHPATRESQKTFVFISSIVFGIIGLFYSAITFLILATRFNRPNLRKYITHDIEYIFLLSFFSIGLLGNSIWHYAYLEHGVYFLLASLLSGWWFSIFFLRAFKSISFYVAMIHRVIFGDLFRFGLFILLSLISFSIAFQVLFQGSGVPTVYGEEEEADIDLVFFRTTMINIRLMLGLGDIEVLHKAREPIIAYIIYIVYVIMTYLVLLNSLIAMISETCASVRENETIFYHTQRLYVMLFLEEISYPFWLIRDKWIPRVLFEERHVKRKGRFLYRSYFVRMTDKSLNKGKADGRQLDTSQQLQPKIETITLNIQQPFLEESIGIDKKTTHILKWKDQKI